MLGQPALPLLEGAKTAQLQQLAQAGAAGVIRQQRRGLGIDRLRVHHELLGLAPRETAAGSWYAASVNLALSEGETAWCCDFVTQRDGKIIDPMAGRISTKESEVLLHALDEQLGSDTRRWEAGEGSHHVLVVRDPSLSGERPPAIPSPEQLLNLRWDEHLPGASAGDALRLLIDEAGKLLDDHPINRVRVDLGENPANLLWLWGPITGEAPAAHQRRTRLDGLLLSRYFPMRGLARVRGFDWKEGPAALDERGMHALWKAIIAGLEHHQTVYVHLRVDTADPVERQCAMERLDQLILKPLTQELPRRGPWRLLVAIDDHGSEAIPFVAIGTGLPQHPVVSLAGSQLAEGSLIFPDAAALAVWFRQGSSWPTA